MISAEAIASAQAAQLKWTIPASISLAQFGLESGWGAHEPPGSNNPFGIKAVPGQPSVTVPTHEFIAGRYVAVEAAFRKFDSLADAFDAHAALLATGTPYYKARECIASGITPASVNAFANALTGVYATDPLYGQKLIQLMTEDDLYHYDVMAVAPTAQLVQPSPPLQPIAAPVSIPQTGAVTSPPVAAPLPQAPVTQVPVDQPIALPSQVVAQVSQLGTHFGALLAGVLGTAGLVAPNQESQIAAFGGSLAVLLLSIGINAGLQYYRHQQALKVVAVAKAS